MSLSPDDREIPADPLDSVPVRLSGLELRRPRVFGNCWLACELWHPLGLDDFWQPRLPEAREAVSWEKVLWLLVVNRLLEPGSEFPWHRQWFVDSAMDELLETDFAVAEKDRLYRCLDRVLKHKQELLVWLKQKWADLFHADFEVLLYDLTSTYFEGEMEQNPKARRGYSRDQRPDCLQLVIALVVTPDGFPLAYEVRNGNTSDRTTLRGFLKKIDLRQSAARMGYGSRHSQRGDLAGDARAGTADLLFGGHTQRPNPPARKEVAGSAVAKGTRLGGGEAVPARRGTLRAGEEGRAAGQGDRDAAQAAGPSPAQAARHAPTACPNATSCCCVSARPRRRPAAPSDL